MIGGLLLALFSLLLPAGEPQEPNGYDRMTQAECAEAGENAMWTEMGRVE